MYLRIRSEEVAVKVCRGGRLVKPGSGECTGERASENVEETIGEDYASRDVALENGSGGLCKCSS